jgi:hypothetical protein
MAPATKKRRRSPYGCADAVTSLLDTLVANEAVSYKRKATPSTTTATTATASTAGTSTKRSIVLTPQAVQAMMICHERFLQILAAELAMGAEGEDHSAVKLTSTTTAGAADADAASARSATGLSVVQPAHVTSAIQQLGWEELAPPVALTLSEKSKRAKSRRAPVPKRAAKARVRKKKKEWTTEELAAQERLLAASKQKLKGQTEA